MGVVDLADAKAHLSEFIDRVEEGDSFAITRRGKAVARLTGVALSRTRIDLAELQALTAVQSTQEETAGEFVRSMRDGDRY